MLDDNLRTNSSVNQLALSCLRYQAVSHRKLALNLALVERLNRLERLERLERLGRLRRLDLWLLLDKLLFKLDEISRLLASLPHLELVHDASLDSLQLHPVQLFVDGIANVEDQNRHIHKHIEEDDANEGPAEFKPTLKIVDPLREAKEVVRGDEHGDLVEHLLVVLDRLLVGHHVRSVTHNVQS